MHRRAALSMKFEGAHPLVGDRLGRLVHELFDALHAHLPVELLEHGRALAQAIEDVLFDERELDGGGLCRAACVRRRTRSVALVSWSSRRQPARYSSGPSLRFASLGPGRTQTHQLLQRRELLVRLRQERLLVLAPAECEEGALLVACFEGGEGGLALAFEDALYLRSGCQYQPRTASFICMYREEETGDTPASDTGAACRAAALGCCGCRVSYLAVGLEQAAVRTHSRIARSCEVTFGPDWPAPMLALLMRYRYIRVGGS